MPQEECYLTHPELFMSGVYFYVRVCSALERYVRAGGAEMELAKALLARLHEDEPLVTRKTTVCSRSCQAHRREQDEGSEHLLVV